MLPLKFCSMPRFTQCIEQNRMSLGEKAGAQNKGCSYLPAILSYIFFRAASSVYLSKHISFEQWVSQVTWSTLLMHCQNFSWGILFQILSTLIDRSSPSCSKHISFVFWNTVDIDDTHTKLKKTNILNITTRNFPNGCPEDLAVHRWQKFAAPQWAFKPKHSRCHFQSPLYSTQKAGPPEDNWFWWHVILGQQWGDGRYWKGQHIALTEWDQVQQKHNLLFLTRCLQ